MSRFLDLLKHMLIETHGTAMLTLIIIASKNEAYVVSLGLWAVILGTSVLSGAHFNPVVTIAGVFLKRIYSELDLGVDSHNLIWYILAQLTGASLGGLLALGVTDAKYAYEVPDDVSMYQAFAGEAIMTMHIVVLVMVVAMFNEYRLLGLLTIAVTFYAGIFIMEDISGGSFNPTVAFFVNLVQVIKHGDASYLESMHVYIFGPIVGGLIGTLIAWFILGDPDLNMKQQESVASPDEQMAPPSRFKTFKFT